ncbi:hypothetical protein V6N13_124210 [Hibiscus sabdariffa]
MSSIPGRQSVSVETDGSNPDFSDSNQTQNQTHSATNETQCSMPPPSKKTKKGVDNKRRSWPSYTHLDGTIQPPKRKALAKMVIVDELALKRKWKYVNWVIEKSFDEDIASELHDRTSHALSSMFASYVVVFDANDKGLDSSVTPMNLEVNATVINDMDDVQTMLEHQFERKIGYGGLEKDRVR